MKKKVLVIDDDMATCKLLKFHLEKNGYAVAYTTKGDEVQDMIKREKPDLVTLDLLMPGMNGYDVRQNVQTLDENIPIVIISALIGQKNQGFILATGADAAFDKPFHLDDLLNTIHDLTSKS